jgi:CBS domain-containing protein
MVVREGMTPAVVTVGPGHTLREAARRMANSRVGAAIVIDPEQQGPGIITERDVMEALAAGCDPDQEPVRDHLTKEVVFATPEWSLEEAAATMVRHNFRHLVVLERGEIVGVISVRDILRCWTAAGAVPAATA